jgi:predicted nuclease with TOPRIM domain
MDHRIDGSRGSDDLSRTITHDALIDERDSLVDELADIESEFDEFKRKLKAVQDRLDELDADPRLWDDDKPTN